MLRKLVATVVTLTALGCLVPEASAHPGLLGGHYHHFGAYSYAHPYSYGYYPYSYTHLHTPVVGYAISPHVVVPHVAAGQSGTNVSDLVNVLRLLHETGGMRTATNSQSGGSDLHDRVSDLTSRITALEKDLEALKGQSGQAGADVQAVLKSLQADIASIKSKLAAP